MVDVTISKGTINDEQAYIGVFVRPYINVYLIKYLA